MGPRDPRERWIVGRSLLGSTTSRTSRCSPTPGFTLVEVVVVLVVLGLGAALVAPALLAPAREPTSITAVIGHVQDMAARRGETLRLEVTPAGSWQVFGTAAIDEGALEGGELFDAGRLGAFTLRVAPLGSCGPTLDSNAAGPRLPVDPLTCRVIVP